MNAKTYSAKPREVGRKWFVMDAEDQILGRLATRVAHVIRGKHKPPFTPHLDVGDFVVVVNAEKVKLTGNKLDRKKFRRHTGYPGGLVEIPYRRLLDTHPERAIEQAVWGMLPKGRLGRQLRGKLKVYKGAEHPHSSQKPEPLGVAGPIPVYVDPEPPPGKRKKKEAKKAAADGETTRKKPATRKATGRKATAKKSPAKKSPAKKTSARKSTARKKKES
jgi:large subunit ribosomal protein L13